MAEEKKSGFVAIIGRPNVGKSTLMNHLIGQKIAITSAKPQTTRNRIQTVYTDERGQVIFLDTPGIHKAKNKLGEFMVKVTAKTIEDADVLIFLTEAGAGIGETEKQILLSLKGVRKPVILVINKVDTILKESITDCIKTYEKEMKFADVVPVSALRGINVDDVMTSIYKFLPYGPMFYDEETVTNQPMREIAAEIVREKALRCLADEIPHGIAVITESMKERPDGSLWDIEATIVCERESHKGIIIGKGGEMIRKIGSQARKDIEEMVESHVNLKLFVKVRKDWRDNDLMIRNFGYRKED